MNLPPSSLSKALQCIEDCYKHLEPKVGSASDSANSVSSAGQWTNSLQSEDEFISETPAISFTNSPSWLITTFQYDTAALPEPIKSNSGMDLDELLTSVWNDSETHRSLSCINETTSHKILSEIIHADVDQSDPVDPRVLDRSRMQIGALRKAVKCCLDNEKIVKSRVIRSRNLRLAYSISSTVGSTGMLLSYAATWPTVTTVISGSLALLGSLLNLFSQFFQNEGSKDRPHASDLVTEFSDARFDAEALIDDMNVILNNAPQDSDEMSLSQLCEKSNILCQTIHKLDAKVI